MFITQLGGKTVKFLFHSRASEVSGVGSPISWREFTSAMRRRRVCGSGGMFCRPRRLHDEDPVTE